MVVAYFRYSLLAVATFPFIYYLIAIHCSWRFFRRGPVDTQPLTSGDSFLPPVSILKPIRGQDPDAYENFASFCRQNYPNYELVFCVDNRNDPVLPILDELRRNFPTCHIRVLYGSGRNAANDKVAKLARLVAEAQHEVVVINDSDVRVDRDYLRTIVAPLANDAVGAVTCFYVPILETGIVDYIQSNRHVLGFLCRHSGRQISGWDQIRARAHHRHHPHSPLALRRLRGHRGINRLTTCLWAA